MKRMYAVRPLRPVLLVHLLCALSLAAAAFTHRLPAFELKGPEPDLSAFVLPDGGLPPLCKFGGDGDDDDGAIRGDCAFCRIAGSVLPPKPGALTPYRYAAGAKIAYLPRKQPVRQTSRPNAASPRGPPALTG